MIHLQAAVETFYVRNQADDPIPEEENQQLYFYDIRHDSNDAKEPFILERAVVKNYFGTVGLRQSLDLDFDDVIQLRREEREFIKDCYDLYNEEKHS